MSVISLTLPEQDDEKGWEQFQNLMDSINEATVNEERKVAEEFGVSFNCAMNIVYLRGRSRWTQKLEDNLIHLDKSGQEQPSINDYGH